MTQENKKQQSVLERIQEMNPVTTKSVRNLWYPEGLSTFFCDAAYGRRLIDSTDRFDLMRARSFTKTVLGGDTQCVTEKEVREPRLRKLYAGAKSIPQVRTAFELVRVAAARKIIDNGYQINKPLVIYLDKGVTAKYLREGAAFSDEAITFLGDAKNRNGLRARFPNAGFTDEAMEGLLNGTTREPLLEPLPPPPAPPAVFKDAEEVPLDAPDQVVHPFGRIDFTKS